MPNIGGVYGGFLTSRNKFRRYFATPPNPLQTGDVVEEISDTGARLEWFWNGTLWLSTQLYIAAENAGVTSGGIGISISVSSDYSKSISSIGISGKTWIEKIAILTYLTGTGNPSTSSSYFTISQNKIYGADSNNSQISINLPTSYSTQNAPLNKYYQYEAVVGQLLNARMDYWGITFQKTGVGIISARINPVLLYREVR